MNASTQELKSQAEVARLANLSQPKFIGLVRTGKIVPDFRCGKIMLFSPEKTAAIKKEFAT